MNADHNNREDQRRDINPGETGFTPSDKELKAQQKVRIKESGLGREQGQAPADEHIESRLSQIDDDTIHLQNYRASEKEMKAPREKLSNDAAEYVNEINDDDNRDHGDSTEDWDAENSKTGRHK